MNGMKLVIGLVGCLVMVGCATQTGDGLGEVVSSLDEGVGLVPCERPVPARGLVCIDGFWSTGDRCHSDRQCRTGSACLAPREPHCFLVRAEDEPTVCPRGSFGPENPILCAPGFEPRLVTRDGCQICAAVEDDCAAAERCRAAGLTVPECLAEIAGRDRAAYILRRAEAAGITQAEALEIVACGGDETRPGVRPRPDGRDRSDRSDRDRAEDRR